MNIGVIDTETSDIENAEVLEFAIVGVSSSKKRVVGRYSTLVKISGDIAIKAQAAHHINKKMLENDGVADLKTALALGNHIIGECNMFAAHNAEFDAQFFPGWPFICTMRCAKQLWPDAPGYSNQVLRYWLGVDAPKSRMPPHRALPDAEVTANVLLELLKLRTPEELLALTKKPILQVNCGMPKHKGLTWAQVAEKDPAYMRWILGQGPERLLPNGTKTGFDEDMLATMRYHLGELV